VTSRSFHSNNIKIPLHMCNKNLICRTWGVHLSVVESADFDSFVKKPKVFLFNYFGFVHTEIMQDVIRSNRKASGTGGGTDWRILLVDQLSMRMVSACCKMHEIASEGITCKFIASFM
jgi:hypothetical protein